MSSVKQRKTQSGWYWGSRGRNRKNTGDRWEWGLVGIIIKKIVWALKTEKNKEMERAEQGDEMLRWENEREI